MRKPLRLKLDHNFDAVLIEDEDGSIQVYRVRNQKRADIEAVGMRFPAEHATALREWFENEPGETGLITTITRREQTRIERHAKALGHRPVGSDEGAIGDFGELVAALGSAR